jgi:uncharacterized Fe-S radical SAM superfamily protein PflX
MDQYHPCGRSQDVAGLNRPISMEEYNEAIDAGRQAGLSRINKG